MTLIKAMATVAGLTGVSRVLGFIRDILTAAILGAGPVADAFFVALKLPNFFRRVTAEGAFNVSFVPVYSEALEIENREQADMMASNVLWFMVCGLGTLSLLMILVMPFVIMGVAPGFFGDALRFDLSVELSRITFPYLLMISVSALLGGVLNALGRFGPFAFAPVLFNLCLITGLLLIGYFESAGHALAWGVFAAGVVQLIWLGFCARRSGFRVRFKRPRVDVKVKKILKLMGPGVIGAGVMHINLFADMIIASFLGTGAISYLYYADRLNQLPLGVVGIAVGTALLPMLSRSLARGDVEEGRDLFNRALEICLLLALPAAVALAVMPGTLITVLFERGAFDAADTLQTAGVLMSYAVGLPAYITIKVFSSVHWARQDTVTPVKISVAATIANIILSLIFIQFMGVAGIALATGLTGWMQFAAHMRALKGHAVARFDERFKRAVPRIFLGCALMAAVLLVMNTMLAGVLAGGLMQKIFGLSALVGSGMLIYGFILVFSGVIKPSEFKTYFKKKRS